MIPRKIRYPAWVRNVQVGQVLRAPSGLLRIVRRREDRGMHVIVYFTIAHCSWTTRCYTIYDTRELYRMGYRPIGGKFSLNTEFDKLIAAEFLRPGPASGCKVHCCDVMGVS